MKLVLLWTYLTQAYVALFGIILMPVYLRYLGDEAFGLVGFYVMLQAWMQVLDMGLTPALSRDMSRLRAGTLTAREAGSRLRTLEWTLGCMACLATILMWVSSNWIGQHWLSAVALDHSVVAQSITLIGCAVALRWLSGIYRASLVGLERQGWVNGLAAGFTTLRFAGVVPLLIFFSTKPEDFFTFQTTVGVIELLTFATIVHWVLSPIHVSWRPDFRTLGAMLPMAGSMAFLSAMWIVLTQIDKLILSSILPLDEYGYFMLAVMAANGVLVLAPPLNQVMQPRMTILAEQIEQVRFVELYRLTSQLSAVMFVGVGGGLAFFAEPLLRIWSGSARIAETAAPILFWYGLANAVVGILTPPFMLQFAKGRLRLHVIGNLILLVTLVPALVFAATRWGAVGAGQVFFITNFLFFLFWIPLVHHRFLPCGAWLWSFLDIVPIGMGMLSWLAFAAQILPETAPVFWALIWIGVSIVIATSLGVVLGNRSRRYVWQWFARRAG
ncbi:lipopolysaccharide biosynthesis protein [Chromatium okenii]|uniref:Polysaccharide biosynthesis protein n=1 Tax=Chromatium okenii TaxID=61644 RepID=A0A2S7XSB7_9GAMM|nr:oligosaccharide flippase family protein [Chromatium okenii]MBV5309722.1 oligosaccharide flippase family protein [Chromatium okenii]PQJ96443.1 hypothetical protein CXB77_06135 [Chromatium okenii]